MSTCHQPTSTTCEEACDLLFAYLEGELSSETEAELMVHMEKCPPCLEFLDSYKKTPGLCRKALAQAVPGEVTARVKDFLRKKLGQTTG